MKEDSDEEIREILRNIGIMTKELDDADAGCFLQFDYFGHNHDDSEAYKFGVSEREEVQKELHSILPAELYQMCLKSLSMLEKLDQRAIFAGLEFLFRFWGVSILKNEYVSSRSVFVNMLNSSVGAGEYNVDQDFSFLQHDHILESIIRLCGFSDEDFKMDIGTMGDEVFDDVLSDYNTSTFLALYTIILIDGFISLRDELANRAPLDAAEIASSMTYGITSAFHAMRFYHNREHYDVSYGIDNNHLARAVFLGNSGKGGDKKHKSTTAVKEYILKNELAEIKKRIESGEKSNEVAKEVFKKLPIEHQLTFPAARQYALDFLKSEYRQKRIEKEYNSTDEAITVLLATSTLHSGFVDYLPINMDFTPYRTIQGWIANKTASNNDGSDTPY